VNGRPPTPRPTASTAARGVVVVVVAALLGILILKNGFDSGATVSTGDTTETTQATEATTTTVAATTTTVNKASFTVLVANASGVSGAAKRLSDKMATDGFTMAEPATATAKADVTKVYFLSGYDAAATEVAAYLNVGPPEPMPEPKLVPDLGQAQVLITEGRDIASSAATPQPTTTPAPTTTTTR
jgi:membrane-associated protease RseP (regulator of RpoE activity)